MAIRVFYFSVDILKTFFKVRNGQVVSLTHPSLVVALEI
jgi:hypothetical protein